MSTKKSYFFEYDLILVFIYYIFIFYYIKMLQTLQLVVSILYDTLYITFSYLFFHFNYILLFLLYKIYFLNFLKIFLFKAKIHTLLNTAYISLSLVIFWALRVLTKSIHLQFALHILSFQDIVIFRLYYLYSKIFV